VLFLSFVFSWYSFALVSINFRHSSAL
jgi:hypothetical protein